MLFNCLKNALLDNGVKWNESEKFIVIEEPDSKNGFPPVYIRFNERKKVSAYKQDKSVCQKLKDGSQCNVKSAFINGACSDYFKGCDYLILFKKSSRVHLIFVECKDQAADADYKKQLLVSYMFIDFVVSMMKIKGQHADLLPDQLHFYMIKKSPIASKQLLGNKNKYEEVDFGVIAQSVPKLVNAKIRIIHNPTVSSNPLTLELKRLIT